ncbi:MAG: WG repeat-containing protein [Pyrinomonadaceae bacterium]
MFAVSVGIVAQPTEGLSLYLVSSRGKAGFMDKTRKIVVALTFDSNRYMLGEFSEGLAEFTDMSALSKHPFSKAGYIDQRGRIIIKPQFDVAYDFSNGRALIKIGDLQSFIDTSGQQIIKLGPYQAGRSFREGLAAIHSNFEFWYVDRDGKVVIPKRQGLPKDFSEGLACVYLRVEGKLKGDYIDRTGETKIQPQYDECFDFSEGLAVVKVAEKFGYIDKVGKPVVPARYKSAYEFSDGRARVSTGDKDGFIDTVGNLVIPEKFDTGTWGFSEGVAPACEKGVCGYIDTTGRYVIPPKFNSAFSFKNGIASVLLTNYRNAYIDKKGHIIWQEIR